MQDTVHELKKEFGDKVGLKQHSAADTKDAFFGQAGKDGHVAKLGIGDGFMGVDKMGWDREKKGPGLTAKDEETPLHMKAGPQTGPELDQAWFDEINSVRTNPKGYAAYVKAIEVEFKDNVWRMPGRTPLRTKEGLTAVRELISFLEGKAPLPAFKPNAVLNKAAAELTNDAGSNGHTNHELSDGTDTQSRLEKFGEPEEAFTELCSYHFGNPRQGVISLLTDDGDLSRNNRTAIFSDDYKMLGLSIGPHKTLEYTGTFILVGGWQNA